MGLPTIGTVSTNQTATGVSSDSRVISMTAGRAYVVCVHKTTGTGTRTFAASDDLGNTYGNYVESAADPTIRSAAHTTICTTGGSATVTVTVTGGTTNFAWKVVEITPTSGVLSVGGTSEFDDGSTVTAHNCAAASGFSPAADSAVVGLGTWFSGSNYGAATAGSGYTVRNTSGQVFCQTITTSTLLTNERAPWTSGTARQMQHVAVWIGESDGSTGQPFRKRWGGIPGNAYTRRGTY